MIGATVTISFKIVSLFAFILLAGIPREVESQSDERIEDAKKEGQLVFYSGMIVQDTQTLYGIRKALPVHQSDSLPGAGLGVGRENSNRKLELACKAGTFTIRPGSKDTYCWSRDILADTIPRSEKTIQRDIGIGKAIGRRCTPPRCCRVTTRVWHRTRICRKVYSDFFSRDGKEIGP